MEIHLTDRSLPKGSSGHETRDAGISPIVLVGAGLAITLALVGLMVYGVFRYLLVRPSTVFHSNPMTVLDPQIPPLPRIDEHPAIEIKKLRADEDHTLSTYGWIDKKAGVVHIPIERAMELQLQRGFPARKEEATK